jgi:hypothetical protein
VHALLTGTATAAATAAVTAIAILRCHVRGLLELGVHVAQLEGHTQCAPVRVAYGWLCVPALMR